MLCPECNSNNCKTYKNFKWVYDGIPKKINGIEGLTSYFQDFNFNHWYCENCDHDWYSEKIKEQKSIIPERSAGILKKQIRPFLKTKKKITDKQLTIDETLLRNYKNSEQSRIDEFRDYLERKEKEIFTILFADNSNLLINYKHRWTKSYQKGIIAKFHQLNAWFHRHNMQVGMLSLTTAQLGYSDQEVLERLLESWAHLQDNLNKRGYLCFKLFEMHDTTGLPHLHVMIIGNLDRKFIGDEIYYGEYPSIIYDEDGNKNGSTLGYLWCNKYNMGDGIVGWDTEKQIYKDHSFDFSYADSKENNIVAYLMSYLRKNVGNEIINNPLPMRFHSLFWESKTRLFSASRYLSFVMKRFKFKSNNKVLFILCGNKEIYSKEKSTAYPCKYQQITRDKLLSQLNLLNTYCYYFTKIKSNWTKIKPCIDIKCELPIENSYRFKYKLLSNEIKNKFNRKMPINIDSNFNISKMFRIWDNEI